MHWYERIKYIDRVRKCYIMWQDVVLAELYHEFSSLSGEFDWKFVLKTENWEICAKRGYDIEIPGIDEQMPKDTFYRANFHPAFIEQRIIPAKRKDCAPMLRELKLRDYDVYEYLCRCHGICGNNELYVSRTPDDVINPRDPAFIGHVDRSYNIPDWNTSNYGWLGYYINVPGHDPDEGVYL